MTDLERVREVLDWYKEWLDESGAALADTHPSPARLAKQELDAHLKEDAEREATADALAMRAAEQTRRAVRAEAELDRVMAEAGAHDDAHHAELTELREAVRAIRDKAINRLTEDSPMLLIDVRELDQLIEEKE